jgi:hypothetical protein
MPQNIFARVTKMLPNSYHTKVILILIQLSLTVSGEVIAYHAESSTAVAGALASTSSPTTAPLPLFPASTSQLPLFPTSFNLPLFPAPASANRWSEWSTWSTCSSSCRPGESHARTRGCLDNKGNVLKELSPCIIAQVNNMIHIVK